ncbi:hypothetical protein EDD36DRAFT_67580 [Exophiala viscosa]|uniref:Uncharacterized protein n=1 Tax=Exophiala viscosa TaxID=2486360 RepID=A0AAN6I989_9EURO|nr:hypothetical protein EDD36DRAFT_67580 [Exophiala viscosa]
MFSRGQALILGSAGNAFTRSTALFWVWVGTALLLRQGAAAQERGYIRTRRIFIGSVQRLLFTVGTRHYIRSALYKRYRHGSYDRYAIRFREKKGDMQEISWRLIVRIGFAFEICAVWLSMCFLVAPAACDLVVRALG